jgi:hypothetical protein
MVGKRSSTHAHSANGERLVFGKFYLVYGFVVLGLVGFAQYRGWSLDKITQVKNIPKSVRDNPGSYRSVYSSYHHYTGGK